MRLPPNGEGRRLILGFLLPSLVLSLVNPFIFPFVFAISLFVLGIPSLFFSIVMEFGINQRTQSDILAVVLGSALVTVAASPWAPFAGGVIGILSSAILRLDYVRSVNANPQSGKVQPTIEASANHQIHRAEFLVCEESMGDNPYEPPSADARDADTATPPIVDRTLLGKIATPTLVFLCLNFTFIAYHQLQEEQYLRAILVVPVVFLCGHLAWRCRTAYRK